MKYKITKRRYIDSIFLLFVGTAGIIVLSLFVRQPLEKKSPLMKPIVSITSNNRFLYIANLKQQDTLNIFDTNTDKIDVISTNSAQNIQHAALFYNHMLYLHGDTNLGMNIDTKKTFENPGDYISPNGKKFISIDTQDANTGLVTFSLLGENNQKTIIETPTMKTQYNKTLGWSPDSNNFYYTTTYAITKQASMSATDTWMQKVHNEMQQMSRVRTWIKSSTTAAVLVFRVNTQTKRTEEMFEKSNLGVIRSAFYNNDRDEFYIANDAGFYRTDPNAATITAIPLSLKTITSMVFATNDNTDRFLHTNGTGLSLADPVKSTDESVYYATNSAVVTPLVLTGDKVIFSIQDNEHFAGEILDIAKKTRTEFGYQETIHTATASSTPILFGGWLKDIRVKF